MNALGFSAALVFTGSLLTCQAHAQTTPDFGQYGQGLVNWIEQCKGGHGVSPQAAIVMCTQVIHIGAGLDLADLLGNRAMAYEQLGDHEHALADLDRAKKLEPKNVIVITNACYIRAVWGRELDQALADCNRSLELRPNDSDTLQTRALVQLRRGKYAEAIADSSVALDLQPNSALALYLRGVARRKSGDGEAGDRDVDAAKVIEPHIEQRYSALGLSP